jgi:ketosteroid isomerase-like protein
MTSATQATRTFLTPLFSSIDDKGFGDSFRAALSEDLTWTATGSSPLAGVYRSKQASRKALYCRNAFWTTFEPEDDREIERPWC